MHLSEKSQNCILIIFSTAITQSDLAQWSRIVSRAFSHQHHEDSHSRGHVDIWLLASVLPSLRGCSLHPYQSLLRHQLQPVLRPTVALAMQFTKHSHEPPQNRTPSTFSLQSMSSSTPSFPVASHQAKPTELPTQAQPLHHQQFPPQDSKPYQYTLITQHHHCHLLNWVYSCIHIVAVNSPCSYSNSTLQIYGGVRINYRQENKSVIEMASQVQGMPILEVAS